MRAATMVLSILLAGCASLPTAPAVEAREVARPDLAAIDALMADYTGEVPGASVLVLHEGEPVVRRSYGLADVDAGIAATPATNYRLASVSKQFTAAAVLLLVDDGVVDLDGPVRQWLPELPPVADGVTVRHLLTHTSGLVDYEEVMEPDPPEQLRDADVLSILAGVDRAYFPPGSDYRYSNSGYALLALLVERASGMDYPDFLQARIFQPLGMDGTLAYTREGPAVRDRAYGHSLVDGGWVRTDQSSTSAVLGDGGVYSSIDDLARWDAALYDDRLLPDRLRTLAFTPATPTDDPDVQYGFGWRITGDRLWHSGETMGFRNVLVRWPEQRLTVVVLTNRNHPQPYPLALRIAGRFLD